MFLNELPMHRWRSNQKGKVNQLRSNNIRQFGSTVAQFESSNQITQIMLFLQDVSKKVQSPFRGLKMKCFM